MKFETSTRYSRTEHAALFAKEEIALVYQSPEYCDFLAALLGERSKPLYCFIYDDSGENVGILPGFVKQGKYGSIYNSLPFYGSNGGILWSSSLGQDEKRIGTRFILKSLHEKLAQEKFLSSTIITSPLDPLGDAYRESCPESLSDFRIGQLSPLSEFRNKLSSNESLEIFFHYKTRNMIKKSQKLEVRVRKSNCSEDFDFLLQTHKENMARIGGKAKNNEAFEKLIQAFPLDETSFLYIAEVNSQRAAALLAIGQGKIFEYFTPVIRHEFRDYQALSAVICFAMNDAIKMGFDWWNWGGTWSSQEGVHTFKKRWGTVDINYHYYTAIFNKSLLEIPLAELAEEYQYFFAYPYKV